MANQKISQLPAASDVQDSDLFVLSRGSSNFSATSLILKNYTLPSPLPMANGGTNSTVALNNNRVIKSVGGEIVEADAIIASRALISDANGIPTQSLVTATELGYLSSATSNIQTQINNLTRTSQFVAQLLGAVANGGYYITLYCQTAGTILSANQYAGTYTSPGTYTIKINDVAVTGLDTIAIAPTNTQTLATGANTFAVGDEIKLIIENSTALGDVYVTVNTA